MTKIIMIIALICTTIVQPTPPQSFGALRLVVFDYTTNSPIQNAVCCIPEINGYFLTDVNGNSTVIDIPIELPDIYESTQHKKYGEITLIVYKKDYSSYVRYNVKIHPSTTRIMGIIYLRKSTADHPQTEIFCEPPDINWTNELLRKYRR